MNIGIVTTWFERGAALVSRAYMEALSQKHRVFIYARGGEHYAQGDPRWDLPNVTWGKRVVDRRVASVDWADLENWVLNYGLDVLIFNEEHFWDVILRCQRLNVLVGAYVDYYTSETIPFFDLYDFLLCNTRRHYSVFRNHPQAIYIPWGTDCSVYQPQRTRRGVSPVRFFHSAGMGGVSLRKGTDILVRAFQSVHGEATLIIHSQVGVEQYGAVADIIQSDPRITFIAKTVSAPGLYHLGDIYVYPTKLEGIGLTIAEALSCGLPVITTDEAPMNEFVREGITGTLVPVSDHRRRQDGYYWPESICSEAALTAAMQFYVDHPRELERHQQQARAYALEYLDWQRNAQGLPGIVESFSRAGNRSRRLRIRVARHERHRLADVDIGLAFEHREHGDWGMVRRHLLHGLAQDPGFLHNRGVWSIGAEAFLGLRIASWLCRRVGWGRHG